MKLQLKLRGSPGGAPPDLTVRLNSLNRARDIDCSIGCFLRFHGPLEIFGSGLNQGKARSGRGLGAPRRPSEDRLNNLYNIGPKQREGDHDGWQGETVSKKFSAFARQDYSIVLRFLLACTETADRNP